MSSEKFPAGGAYFPKAISVNAGSFSIKNGLSEYIDPIIQPERDNSQKGVCAISRDTLTSPLSVAIGNSMQPVRSCALKVDSSKSRVEHVSKYISLLSMSLEHIKCVHRKETPESLIWQ